MKKTRKLYDKGNIIVGLLIGLLVGFIVGWKVPFLGNLPVSNNEMSLYRDMRKLWEDHVTWTRVYIIDTTANLPNAQYSAQRLLKNQEDIGNAIKPYYGEEAGNQLTTLLKEHITTAVDLINAAKKG